MNLNRELVRLANAERRVSLAYLLLFACAAVMVGNLLREAFHLRARASAVAAAFSARADRLAARTGPPAPATNLTVAPAVPAQPGGRS
jgi:uncharacterized membrane protein YjjB (DUF3815 family)